MARYVDESDLAPVYLDDEDIDMAAKDRQLSHSPAPKPPNIDWLKRLRSMAALQEKQGKPSFTENVGTMISQLAREAVTGKVAKTDELVNLKDMMADPGARFSMGAARPALGAYQAASKLPLSSLPPVEPTLRAIDALKKETMGDSFDTASLVGEMFNPIALGVTKAIPPAVGLTDRVRKGGIAGLAYALPSPTDPDKDFGEEKIRQAVMGLSIGGGVPLATSGARFTGNLAKDLWRYVGSPNAGKNLSDDYISEIVGEGNIPKLIAAARGAREIVPGSKPTTAQAVAGMPEGSPLSALTQKVAGSPGGISAQFGARKQEQEAAREAWLRSHFGSRETLKAAERTAEDNAKAAYGPLMGRQVSPQSDVDIFLRNIQDRRGVPWTGPSQGSGPFTGRAGALQAWGKSATDEAQNRFAANNWFPVAGQPRVSPRYSPRTEVADQAQVAMRESLGLAQTRGKEAEFVEQLFERMSNNGKLAEKGFAEFADRPSVINAIDFARKLAREGKYKFPSSVDDNFSVQNLHDIKLGIDAQIKIGANKNHPAAMDESMLARVNGTKGAFIDWLESKVPEYGKARTQFSKDMTEVERQKVGQALIDKLRTVTGQESPGSFLRAVDDEAATIKKLTGQPRFTLDQLFNPKQRDAITRTTDDLERALAAVNPPQRTNLGTTDLVSDALPRLPKVLSRPIVIANHLISMISSRAGPLEKKMNEINAIRMLHPEEFAKAMDMIPSSQKQQILNTLRMEHGVGLLPQFGIGAPYSIYEQEQR
jgi:hypothetical protein